MKQTYMPCIDCAYGLQARNTDLETLWVWLVERITFDNPYILISLELDRNGTIEKCYDTLEDMRFIVTHEDGPHSFIVKILGFREGSQLICVHRHIS